MIMNQSYDLEIEILTPVHIWNWNTISWIDYFCYQEDLKAPYKKSDDWKDIKHQSFLYKYKINNLRNILDENDKKELESLFMQWKDTFEIRNFIFKKLETDNNKYKEKFINICYKKIPIKNSFYKNWKEKIIWKTTQIKWKTQIKKENEFNNQLSQLNIQCFIHSMWRYYIPWSSLKWAIRTVLTNSNIESSKTENDPFKKLIVRDSEFINDGIEIWKLARQHNKWEWIYAEFLKPWVITNIQIIFKDFIDETNLEKIDLTKDNLLKKANIYLEKKIMSYLEDLIWLKNLALWNKKKIAKIESNIDSLNKILCKLKNLKANECILNIWFWWGFWFKSFEWNKNHPNKQDENINIPRTNYNIDLENLWFIKCTFKN